jgi:alkylhydroperoxidase family enzyme
MGARFALARQQGLTEELVAEIPNFESSGKLTGQEKAAIGFAEILAGDHRQASQQTFDVLREHFTESEIVDLGFRIVTFVGYGRLIHTLGLEIGKTCPL